MKKLILLGAIVIIGLLALVFVKNRFGMESRADMMDLVIVNDSPDVISVEYKEGDKDVSPTVNSGAQISGGKGFIRIFTDKKMGSYEIFYQYPRPEDAPQQVTLSQIVGVTQKKNLGSELYTEKGMIGDIKVEYEEPRELD